MHEDHSIRDRLSVQFVFKYIKNKKLISSKKVPVLISRPTTVRGTQWQNNSTAPTNFSYNTTCTI